MLIRLSIGRCRQRWGGVAAATLTQCLGDIGPGREAALAAGLDDAGERGEGARALGIAGAVAQAPGDDPMAQRPLGGIVGQRQLGMIEHHPEGVPVVEQLAGQRRGLGVARLGVLQAQRKEGVEGRGVLLAQRDGRGPSRAA